MGSKSEIGWTRRLEDGSKVDVVAHRNGRHWEFVVQQGRFERWEPLEEPLLEDWLHLLAAVERRVSRRMLRPEEPERIRKRISELFRDHVLE